VRSGSPAANAGLQPGDRLTKFNGKAVTSGAEVAGMVTDTPPGSVFPIQFVRGGKTIVNFMQL
jgi:serine protease Do